MSVTGINSIISATLSGETDIICDNLTANTITLPSGDLQTTLDNIVAGTGETGPAGADGQSVSFYAPLITTLSAGSSATVSDVITTASNTQNHQLTFNIPRGDKGEKGNQGSQGEKGDKGNDGADGNSAAATAAAAAAGSAGLAAVAAASSSTSATASAVSAASAASSAASANATATATDARTAFIDTNGLTPYTVFNRNGGNGVDFLGYTDVSPKLTIFNSGAIYQYAYETATFYNLNINNTTTLQNTVINGTLTLNNNAVVYGNLTATLTGSATQIIASVSAANTDFNVPFLSSGTGAVSVLTDIVNFTYNPSTDTLKCGNFEGTAKKVLATTNDLNVNYYIPFLSAATGSVDILTDLFDDLRYNPFTNVLSSINFSGNLTGTATNATKILATNSTTSANYNIPFLSAATGNVDVLTDGLFGMTYNPSTNLLTVQKIAVDTLQGSTINVGDTDTSTINIEGANGCVINIGIAAFLNTINIGNNYSNVNIKGVADTAIAIFNPMDQMNGIF